MTALKHYRAGLDAQLDVWLEPFVSINSKGRGAVIRGNGVSLFKSIFAGFALIVKTPFFDGITMQVHSAR